MSQNEKTTELQEAQSAFWSFSTAICSTQVVKLWQHHQLVYRQQRPYCCCQLRTSWERFSSLYRPWLSVLKAKSALRGRKKSVCCCHCYWSFGLDVSRKTLKLFLTFKFIAECTTSVLAANSDWLHGDADEMEENKFYLAAIQSREKFGLKEFSSWYRVPAPLLRLWMSHMLFQNGNVLLRQMWCGLSAFVPTTHQYTLLSKGLCALLSSKLC